MASFTIGQVARRAQVGVETVRFYERKGLLKEPHRGPSGYRQYNDEVVAELYFIKQAKQLGFTLKEIKELLSLRVDETQCADEAKELADAKIADIEAKIHDLQKMKKALADLTSACRGHVTVGECPLLTVFNRETKE